MLCGIPPQYDVAAKSYRCSRGPGPPVVAFYHVNRTEGAVQVLLAIDQRATSTRCSPSVCDAFVDARALGDCQEARCEAGGDFNANANCAHRERRVLVASSRRNTENAGR